MLPRPAAIPWSPPTRCAGVLAALIACAIGHAMAAAGGIAQPLLDTVGASMDDEPADLIDRIVYLQEFDDPANVQPIPVDWYRIDAPDYPSWNEIGYLPRRPTPGQVVPRLYELSTQGGSTGIRLKAGAALIYAGTDHGVSVRVRTEDLNHARARVAARLLDVNGHAIPGSEAISPAIDTAGEWHVARLHLVGDFPLAVSIQIDLRLEQPDQWRDDPRHLHESRLRDVRGRVQFDRLVVWRCPKIELALNGAGNIIQAPDQPEITLQVSDIPRGMREGRLRLYDEQGRLVDAADIPFELGRQIPPWKPKITEFGWYRVVLEVYEAVEPIGNSWADFAWLPRWMGDTAPPFEHFGVVADDVTPELLDIDLPLLVGTGVGQCSLRLWPETMAVDAADAYRRSIGPRIEQMAVNGVRPTFAISSIPPDLAAELVRAPSDVVTSLADDGMAVWGFIEPFLIDFGQRVTRWQMLSSRDESLCRQPESISDLHLIQQRLQKLVPEPTVIAPWAADRQLLGGLAWPDARVDGSPGSDASARTASGATLANDVAVGGAEADPAARPDGAPDPTSELGDAPPHRLLVRVPAAIRPEHIAEYVAMYARAGVPAAFVLETLDPHEYGVRAVAGDLMRRAALAWEAGAEELWIDRPWRHVGTRTQSSVPAPLLPVWRTLGSHLDGRPTAVRMPLGPEITGIIFHGPNGGTIAVWDDSPRRTSVEVRVYLGDQTVYMTDAEGNRKEVPVVDGEHRLTIGRAPMFVDGVDVDLALFRANLRVAPGFVEASSALQQHDLVLYNPWKVPISGRFRIVGPAGWRFPNRLQRISIPPGATRRYPLDFSLPLNELAGATAIEFEMELQARTPFTRLRLQAPIEVGHRRIVLTPSYYLDPQPDGPPDLVVRHEIRNQGTQPVWLKTFVTTRGFKYREQPVSNLGPGETAVRLFRFEGGASALSGQRIKVGLRELDGTGQLNLVLDIK